LKELIEEIEAKKPEDRTEEEKVELEKYEKRRSRKNNRSRERALEKKAEVARILDKPERKRTKLEIAFLDVELNARSRKNEGDRIRRKIQKLTKQGLPVPGELVTRQFEKRDKRLFGDALHDAGVRPPPMGSVGMPPPFPTPLPHPHHHHHHHHPPGPPPEASDEVPRGEEYRSDEYPYGHPHHPNTGASPERHPPSAGPGYYPPSNPPPYHGYPPPHSNGGHYQYPPQPPPGYYYPPPQYSAYPPYWGMPQYPPYGSPHPPHAGNPYGHPPPPPPPPGAPGVGGEVVDIRYQPQQAPGEPQQAPGEPPSSEQLAGTEEAGNEPATVNDMTQTTTGIVTPAQGESEEETTSANNDLSQYKERTPPSDSLAKTHKNMKNVAAESGDNHNYGEEREGNESSKVIGEEHGENRFVNAVSYTDVKHFKGEVARV